MEDTLEVAVRMKQGTRSNDRIVLILVLMEDALEVECS